MPPATRRHRGVDPDQRRRDRRARLVTACLDLVGEGGVAAVTAESVAARAGLTKRYFYESFSDRDALLEQLLGEYFTEIHASITGALAATPSSAGARAHTIAETLVDSLRQDPRRARLYIESPGVPRLQARREAAYEQYTQLLLANFPPGGARPPCAEATTRQRFAALLVVAGTTQAVITWLRGDLRIPRRAVIDELARVIIAALPS